MSARAEVRDASREDAREDAREDEREDEGEDAREDEGEDAREDSRAGGAGGSRSAAGWNETVVRGGAEGFVTMISGLCQWRARRRHKSREGRRRVRGFNTGTQEEYDGGGGLGDVRRLWRGTRGILQKGRSVARNKNTIA